METNNARFIEEQEMCVSVATTPKFEEMNDNSLLLDQQLTTIPLNDGIQLMVLQDAMNVPQHDVINTTAVVHDNDQMTSE